MHIAGNDSVPMVDVHALSAEVMISRERYDAVCGAFYRRSNGCPEVDSPVGISRCAVVNSFKPVW